MADYTQEHADALADIRDAGTAVTFTKKTQSYDPETGVKTPTTTTVAGQAVRVRGNPKQYEQLELVEAEAPTLLFAPTTFGDEPGLGSTVTWNGETYTVRNVDPVAPDGNLIIARIIIAQ